MRPYALILVCLALASVADAQPPVVSAPVAPTSGPACATIQSTPIPLKSEPLDISVLEGSAGRVGQLRYDGGVSLSSDDPRFGGITGLQFDDKYGLVAITKAGNWIILDAQGTGLLDIKHATITPIQAVPGQEPMGPPSAVARLTSGYLVAFDAGRSIARFNVSACAFSARAEPVGNVRAPEHLIAMAPVGYKSMLFAGIEFTGGRRDLVNHGPERDMALAGPEIPAVPGYELAAASGPQSVHGIGLVALWQPFGGGARTRIQVFDLPKWADVLTPGRQSTGPVVGSVPVSLRAVTSYLDSETNVLHIWTATSGDAKAPVQLFAFSIRVN